MPFLYLGLLDPYPHRTKQPSRMRPMLHNAPLQAHTTLFPPTYYVLALCVALDPTYLGSILPAWLPGTELPPTRAQSPMVWKNQAAREKDHASHFCSQREIWTVPWPMTPWRRTKLYVAWITVSKLMTLLTARKKKVPRPCSATKPESRILPN